jgi:hypothetical protein
MKDTLDLASKLIFQTADTKFQGRNVLSAIETGEIMIHTADRPLTRLANDKPDIVAMQQFSQMWNNLGQEITSTPEAMRGTTMPSGTPYSLGAYLGGQANSLFELMTENKGLSIEDMARMFVIDHLKKKLKHKDEIVGILDDAGVEEIDAMFVPSEAIKRFNKQAKEDVLAGEVPEQFNQDQAEAQVRQSLDMSGNQRFFKPDELDQKDWDELFGDFDWNNIRVEVTNEQSDKQAVLQTLSALYTSLVTVNRAAADVVMRKILTETGVVSPMELSAIPASPPIAPEVPTPGGGGAEAITSLAQ